MSSLVLLDNEAVQALGDVQHPKHRRVLSHVQVVAQRRRRAVQVALAVPTSVRVEAGWDRTAASWALVNRLRVTDEVLDAAPADLAAAIRTRTGVSMPDAHLGAVVQAARAEKVTVVTSDPADMVSVAEGRPVVVVTI